MIIIQGGRVIDPKSGFDGLADVALEDGKIARIVKRGAEGKGESIAVKEGDQVICGEGLVIAPGLVDVHVHFRDPGFTYKEDIHTGAKAAAKGGFTTVVCMANTNPKVDKVETLQYVLEEGKKTGIHVLSCGAVSKGFDGRTMTDMEALKAAGAAGFTDDGVPLRDQRFLYQAMKEAARLKLPISLHEEDPAFIQENGINHGAVSEKLGIYGSPALAEDAMVARDCMIALDTGARVDIQHISSGNAVAMVRLAKSLGADVWAEVTPHHFTLTEDAVLEYGSLAKMNPPLRTQKDRQQLIEGLKDGTIDMIATDHAPHSREEKEGPLTKTPSGIIGLETSLALGITQLVEKGHLTLLQLMEKMSFNPARMYGLDCGRLEEGAPADLVIFDDKKQWTVKGFVSKASNSPFLGWNLTGKVVMTICGGKIVYQEDVDEGI
ncbi:MAG TPA: dihydroorotase [Candidatus Cottocaccamicrobium excrementipullorum]|nr:dihydroorotase [Candidatus Cottocaccamicrobium excrementipullorum]